MVSSVMTEAGVPRNIFLSAVPRLSIALPVFNAGVDLRLAIASILNQTFADWELLLLDDGSTDGAIDALDLKDSRIWLIRDGTNRGLAERLNQAIDLARGTYFARMDADDISHPERFARQIEFLDAHPKVDLLGCRTIVINEVNSISGMLPFARIHDEICARPWRSIPLAHPSWTGRTSWFRHHRYADPAPYYCEDQELLLRSHRNSTFAALPDALLAYRMRGALPWTKLRRARRAFQDVQTAYWRGRPDVRAMLLALGMMRLSMDILQTLTGHASAIRRAPDSARTEWEALLARLTA